LLAAVFDFKFKDNYHGERTDNAGMHVVQAAQLRDDEEQAQAFGARRVYKILPL
jgi:hypothetical protein